MKLSIIIPVLNEANTVRQLLRAVIEEPLPVEEREIIIVESNSVDGTREIIKEFLSQFKNTVEIEIKTIWQNKAHGKGNSVREGFKHVTGDIILIQDGDLEYRISDYPDLLAPIIDAKTDFVLGSRHLSAGSWKIREFEKNPFNALFMNFGGILFHSLFNLVYGQRLTDPTTMFKVFRTRCIRGVKFYSNRFDFDFELMAKLIRLGYRPIEIPISYRSRGFSEGKKINLFRDPFTYLWAIFRFRFEPLGKSVS